MAEELPILRYYTNQSFVTFEPDSRVEAGRWPVRESPLRIRLDQAPN